MYFLPSTGMRAMTGIAAALAAALTFSLPASAQGSPATAAEPSNERRASFLAGYASKYKAKEIPVPMAAAQCYDAVYRLVYSLYRIGGGKLTGPAIKAAL